MAGLVYIVLVSLERSFCRETRYNFDHQALHSHFIQLVMDSLQFNYNMDEGKPIFTTASENLTTTTTVSTKYNTVLLKTTKKIRETTVMY